MRSVWSGAVSFGLVSIPVKLYPATEAKDVRFHLVDPETGRRVRYRRVVQEDRGLPDVVLGEENAGEDDAAEDDAAEENAAHEVRRPAPEPPQRDEPRDHEVAFEDLERAYEIEPGEQVTVTQEELRRLRPPRSRTIEIEDFVDLASIDPVYFEKSYVLAPEYGGAADKPYVLLMRALERRANLLEVLRSTLDQRSVFMWIGGENPAPELRTVSVVGANYGLGYRNLGTVGVVGPLRMDYATWGLRGSRAEYYLARPEPLAWGLSMFMQTSGSRAAHKRACLERIRAAGLPPSHRRLLLGGVGAHLGGEERR